MKDVLLIGGSAALIAAGAGVDWRLGLAVGGTIALFLAIHSTLRGIK